MKEHIYTIPINDAFDSDYHCPLCYIAHLINSESIERTIGASMMEPDARIITNKQGFCRLHYDALLAQQNSLSLALIMQTHLAEQRKAIAPLLIPKTKKKESKAQVSALSASVERLLSSCAICERNSQVTSMYLENIVFLWRTESEFRDKFDKVKGFCFEHLSLIISEGMSRLNETDFNALHSTITAIQSAYLNELQQSIDTYCNAYDYRSAPLTEAQKNALKQTIDVCCK